MYLLSTIISYAITSSIKIISAKLLYKKFGPKSVKYFNITIAIVTFLFMSYFIFNYPNTHPMYPIVYGISYGLIFANIRVSSDNKH